MKIGVIGHGHFAGVVAHCLTQKGHAVAASDFAPFLFRPDQRKPSDEPGWILSYATPPIEFMTDADVVWIAYDVPLDSVGAPVVTDILARILRLHEAMPNTIPFLVSCQWPVGTTRQIAALCESREFIYVMENVRAGKAIADFLADPFPAIGALGLPQGRLWKFIRSLSVKEPWCANWDTIEFAKHSMNAFLALQIAFVNELARLAPHDVNMAEVTRVLKSDPRVSSLAPLTAGPAFGGGSLKRDLLVLESLLNDGNYAPIIAAILPSNEAQA